MVAAAAATAIPAKNVAAGISTHRITNGASVEATWW
jgi:hypothetical protein